MQQSYTARVVSLLINDLFTNLDTQIRLKEVAQLAPSTTAQQTSHAITTLVFVSHAEKFTRKNKIVEEKDPLPATIDSFSTGKIDKEIRDKNVDDNGQKTIIDKSRSIASQRSKNSFRSSRFVPDASFKETKKEQSIRKGSKDSLFLSLYAASEVVDQLEEKMRKAENQRVQTEEKIKTNRQKQLKQREKNESQGQKLLKDKNGFTFDYEGRFYGIHPTKLPMQAVRKMREELKNPSVFRKNLQMSNQPTQIENQKLKNRQIRNSKANQDTPIFSDKSFSIIQAIGDKSNMQEGIKITQLRGGSNTVFLQKARKQVEGHKTYRLKDYKQLSKNKSFKEFPLASSRKSSQIDISNSEAADTIEQNMISSRNKSRQTKSRGKSQEQFKVHKQKALNQAMGRGLPFIRTKGLKFYDVGSSNSHRTLDLSFSTTEKKSQWRSKIKISDISLFDGILMS